MCVIGGVTLFSYIIPHLYFGGIKKASSAVCVSFSVNCCTGEGEGGGFHPLRSLAVCHLSKGFLPRRFSFFFFSQFYLGSSAAALIGTERTGWRLCLLPESSQPSVFLTLTCGVKHQLVCCRAGMLWIYGELLFIFPHLKCRMVEREFFSPPSFTFIVFS